jgi:hypothetical protein
MNPNHDLYFLPETYRLKDPEDRRAFQHRLENGGKSQPWMMKDANLNNGEGIRVLGPNSHALTSVLSHFDPKHASIVQKYIRNELTWWNGEKFDLRMYWALVSVDPPIVLYHDGYVRVSGALYNETDFSITANHLTNHNFRSAAEGDDVTAAHLWQRIQDHYKDNVKLSTRIKDPVQHVRKQMKEAIATLYAAFRDVFGAPKSNNETASNNIGPENLFSVYGADFIIDNDLDVYFIEAQAAPGFDEYDHDYRIDMFREIYRPVISIVEEIALKQSANAHANIMPLTTLAGYEIVYAGDWQYKYKKYQRSPSKSTSR